MTDHDQETTGRTVVGMFRDRARAESAIRDLKTAGFTEEQIGVAMQDRERQDDLAESTGTRAAEGAATGALSGGVIGGLIGLLGSLLVPGLGPIVVGGVLASTLTGAGIGAATGGLIGALMGLGIPEEDARHFELGIREGGVLVTVEAGSRTGEALAILEHHGTDLGPSGGRRYDRGLAPGAVATPGLASATYGNLGVTGEPSTSDAAGGSAVGSPGIATPGIGIGDVASGSSTGDRGMSSRPHSGPERRVRRDPAYAGPERRLARI